MRIVSVLFALAAVTALPAFADTPAPWPVNADRAVARPQQFAFSAADVQAKTDFVAFGKIKCSDCEGGYAYDSSLRLLAPGLLADKALEKKVGAMKAGDSFAWKGAKANGRLEVTGEQAVGGFPCRQVRYSLSYGNMSAQRPGLFCYGKREYSTVDEWIEVF